MKLNKKVDYNGTLLSSEEKLLSVFNSGFRYGDALFETIFFDRNSLRLFPYHWDRISSGFAALDYNIPEWWSEDFFKEKILSLIQNNSLITARIRLTVWRGNAGLGTSSEAPAEYLIETFPVEEFKTEGISLGLYTDIRKSPSIISRYKNSSYLLNVMAANYSAKHQLDDCLYLNDSGRICESSISNVFWVKNQSVFTTPLSEGPVDGVMRRHIITTLNNSPYRVTEIPITPEELLEADEIFLTNAIRGVMSVGEFLGKKLKGFTTYNILHTTYDLIPYS